MSAFRGKADAFFSQPDMSANDPDDKVELDSFEGAHFRNMSIFDHVFAKIRFR
jgi:hypothetical protein